MQNNPTCPACGSSSWTEIGSRTYRSSEGATLPPYTRRRLDVLFKVWFPGSSAVTLASVVCEKCGFVSHCPRADENDIDLKYAYLCSDHATKDEISATLASDMKRSQELFDHLGHSLSPNASILDFGGGTGRLMQAFLVHGHRCHLIDFPGEKIPHIEYLGSRLGDIPEGMRFDLIVCSHVLEHLAAPYGVVDELSAHLTEAGSLYVEVPLEIWKKAPLPAEPVTHINYFTRNSLRSLLERAGYHVTSCKEGLYTTEGGSPGLAIRAIARLAQPSAETARQEFGAGATHDLIRPSLIQQLIRAFRYPVLTRRAVAGFLQLTLGRTPFLWRLTRKSRP